jgi:hypothetical protein
MKFIKILIILIVPLLAQSFDSYYALIEQGKLDCIREELPKLKHNFGSSPDVLYIAGLVETDGKVAINIFTDFYKKYPNHDKADNAFIKLIEYDYTRGLYNKSIKNCNHFLRHYNSSENIENCINVLINSHHAIGNQDSAGYYYKKYKNLIPHLNLTYSNSQYKPNLAIVRDNSKEKDFVSYQNKSPLTTDEQTKFKYTLQLGAFTSPTNANLLKEKLEKSGYRPYTKKIEGKNGQLIAVRVGYFENRKIAEQMGDNIKDNENLDYMVIKIN